MCENIISSSTYDSNLPYTFAGALLHELKSWTSSG